ncbi:thermonuclease family protein [Shimia haliotis]|uniref:Nuclease homologue n=1 Tax=Shimia haliotis TaxID=1280847 RepID=A0A1I4DYN8_9RHOB|nr:thermonuclease family protein [Shimia haliotis]SFK97011.1 nuclease homologue [Shimia haliotis]
MEGLILFLVFVLVVAGSILLFGNRSNVGTSTDQRPQIQPLPRRAEKKAQKKRPEQKRRSTEPGKKGPLSAEEWCRENNVPLPPMPESLSISGPAYVIDGDTIRIKKTKIRLAGIDAPETDQPYGQKSKWAMVRICKGKTITAKLDGKRSYDRLVGTCYLPDGSDIGAEIVKEGLALDLAVFSGGKYRHLEPDGARRKLAFGKFGHRSIKRQSGSST